MKFSTSTFVALALLPLAVISAKVNPLPAPRSLDWLDTTAIAIDLDRLHLELANYNEIVHNAFDRSLNTVKSLKWTPAAVEAPISKYQPFPTGLAKRDTNASIETIKVSINDAAADLQFGVNETYTMAVSSGGIEIVSETIWGTLHAFSTLQQLIIYEEGAFQIEGSVKIWDAPLYPHRGILIDSGRNFLSLKLILQQIDMLALSKLNVLHWHIEDSQSWPIQLQSYPQMVKDAYSEREQYSAQDISYVVEYAKQRGVRVMPEIDMPGHSRAGWKQISEDLLACQDSWWSNDVWSEHTAVEPPPGQLDVLNEDIYPIVANIYDELSKLFTENLFHVGADELQANCYNFSTKVQDFFKANASRTMKDVSQRWLDRTLPIFYDKPERKLVMWEDILTTPEGAHNVSKDIILQSWNNGIKNIDLLTGLGYDVIVSSSDHLYLDCGYGGWVTNDIRYVDDNSGTNEVFNTGLGGSWCAPYKTWQRIYDYDFTANLTDTQKGHILGAEAALWSEQVDDTVLSSKIWPRAAALAESVWSGNRDPTTGFLRTNQLTQRILNFREYLVALGYTPSPLVPKFCLQNPHGCDLYYNQTVMDQFGTN